MTVLITVRFASTMGEGTTRSLAWLAAVPPMFISCFIEGGTDPLQDVLRVARQAVFFFLIVAVVRGTTARPTQLNSSRIMRWIGGLSWACLALLVIQVSALRAHRYFGFSRDAYSMEAVTIPSDLDLRFSHIRPAATFSEPSYLGFVLLSILLVAIPGAATRRGYPIVTGVALLCGFLSESSGFILFGTLMIMIAIGRRSSRQGWAMLIPVSLVALAAIIAFGAQIGIISRLMGGLDASQDYSIFVRVFGPLQILPEFLLRYPLGLPFSRLELDLGEYTGPLGIPTHEFLMNGFFNLFFEFGLVGVALAAALTIRRDILLSVYILSCMINNGAFLSPDKFAIIGFFSLIYTAFRAEERGSQRQVPKMDSDNNLPEHLSPPHFRY